MNRKNNIPWEIADLIIARLNETITADESARLDKWLALSPDHRILFEKVKEQKNFELFLQQSVIHDYRPHYQSFCKHIAHKKRRIWRIRVGWAAAVVVPLVFFGGWYLHQHTLSDLAIESITPGQYQALLILPDGETIHLVEGEQEGKLKETNAYIRKDTLSYELAETKQTVFHRIKIPRGGEYLLKLSDGTQVWLNAESELHYPVAFTGTERKVLLKGEAYFQVSRDTLHPFVVETGKQKLTVLGTSFGIRAYEDENHILTTLETGKVKVETENQQIILNPDDQACYENNELYVKKVNTSIYTAWHKGLFVFQNQALCEILNTLARWYNIEVFYGSSGLEMIHFTGELQRYADIREFLDQIQLLEKVRFTVKGRTVTVSKY